MAKASMKSPLLRTCEAANFSVYENYACMAKTLLPIGCWPAAYFLTDVCESDADCPVGLECHNYNPTYFQSYCRPVKRKYLR